MKKVYLIKDYVYVKVYDDLKSLFIIIFNLFFFHSDGSGRSGALAALMYCIERVKLEGVVDVFQAVRCMRGHRVSLVQSLVSCRLFLYAYWLKFFFKATLIGLLRPF